MSDNFLALDEMAAVAYERGDTSPSAPAAGDSAAARLVAEDQHRRERERLARRAEVRQQIKQRAVLMQQVEDLEAQLRELDKRADQAAEKHQAACEPIQRKLESASGTQRTKLLSELTTINLDLERELEVIDRTRNPLIREHRETRSAAAGLPTEQRLAGGDLASPALLAEKHATECRRRAAEMRVDRAAEMLRRFVPELETMRSARVPESSFGWVKSDSRRALDFEAVHRLQLRADRWQCELTHASQEAHAAQEALADLAAQMRTE